MATTILIRGKDNGAYVLLKERLGDKAFFSYGEREDWYLSAIHTRSHVALFTMSAREDNRGAKSRISLLHDTGQQTQRLDQIDLYAKDFTRPESKGTLVASAHFQFDYSLQRGAPGGASPTTGRLTLNRLWTKFPDNTRGVLSPYDFDYVNGDPVYDFDYVNGDPANNPTYQWNAADRWGTYQAPAMTVTPQDCEKSGAATDPTLTGAIVYTTQDAATRARDAPAWSLRRIVEPTGREITVDYESDAYGYVQDLPATVMTRVAGVTDPAAKTNLDVIDRSHTQPDANALRVYFSVPPGTLPSRVLADYVGPSKQVFFRIRIALKDGLGDPPNSKDGKWETVSGYAHVRDGGVTTNEGGQALGWLEFEPVEIEGAGKFHPFSLAAWQHLRLVQPDLISAKFINGDPSADPFAEVAKAVEVVDLIDEIATLARGIYPTWFYCSARA